jgi:Na+/pantothenate symporter
MLGWVDVAVVVLYLVLVLAIGLGARFFPGSSSSKGGGKDVAEYFLAGRNVAWWAVGMSLFSSNIGSEHFVGSPPPSPQFPFLFVPSLLSTRVQVVLTCRGYQAWPVREPRAAWPWPTSSTSMTLPIMVRSDRSHQ